MRFILLSICLFIGLGITTGQKDITLEDIYKKGTFRTNGVPGFNFMEDGRHYTALVNNNIVRYDMITGQPVETILAGAAIDVDYVIDAYEFANNETYIILRANTQMIFRRSYTAEYILYNRETGQSQPIANSQQISYATLDPSGASVAYVKGNNLYIENLNGGSLITVTRDGEKNNIINGHTDWVYEEEFGFVKAFEWSKDGNHLAFIRFDEQAVKEFTMTLHHNDAYPEYETFKYPKVGEKNSEVEVRIYHLNSATTTKADLGVLQDMYIPRIKWSEDNDHVCIYKMNRHQNHLQIFHTNVNTGISNIMLEESNDWYIDIHDNLTFIDNGNRFIWTSEQDGYNHLYVYNIDGTMEYQLTKGSWEVTEYYGYDEANKDVYFQSTEPGSKRRNIYKVGIKGNGKKPVADKRGYNRAQFSSTFDYYVIQHSDHNTPPTYKVYDRQGKVVRVLEENESLLNKMAQFDAAAVELIDLNVDEDVELNAAVIKPKNFDAKKKYPLLMFLYGGPGSQMVLDRWNSFRYYWWFQLLAQKGYIVAIVDNRGTGGKGEEFKKMTYLQLGKYETEDQINAARQLGAMDYIDEDRIGIFGWSYGGFMSTLCILKGSDVFKAAIAVAPVTNWKWYDTIYTERYMRTDDENESGYYENSPINFADRLKGNYLLIHGMADDNVHFQNTAEMANALISHNKQFDTYFYPNRNHGIYGDNARLHLFTKMTNFVLEKL